MPTTEKKSTRLYRSEKDRIVAGVCGGLGKYFEIDPLIFRLGFVLLTLGAGSGIAVYLVLWLLVPNESQTPIPTEDLVKENAEELKNKAEEFAGDIKKAAEKQDARNWWGLGLVLLGIIFLSNNFGIFRVHEVLRLWPLVLVAVGAAILLKKND